jgi:signal transduction histidine kinase/CheY-like chemotaxis protein
MKKPGLYIRFLLVITLTGFIYIFLLSLISFFTNKQENLIYNASQEQFDQMVGSMMNVKRASLNEVVYDYTFWDEFVDAISENDSNWFANYITTTIGSFHFDYVCVYDTNLNLVHEASSEEFEFHGIIPDSAIIRLKELKFNDFFLRLPEGLIQVSGATVHANDDPDHNKTRPKGYFLVSKIWNDSFINHLAEMSGASVNLKSISDTLPGDDKHILIVSHDLEDWKHATVGTVLFSRELKALNLFSRTSLIMQVLIILFVVGSWLILRITTGVWIIKPLKLVSGVLASEEKSFIDKLKRSPGEFNRIGLLFENYIRQKKELKEAKDYAEKSDRLKTEFLHNMTHEIRTPINGIMGFSNLLKRADLAPEERDEFIHIIRTNSQQLMRIIDDILEISKLETKQVRIINGETDINHLLADMYAIFKIKTEEKNIDLILKNDLAVHESRVIIDESKLLKIMNNLVKNAIKFTSRGFVEIGCQRSDNRLVFYIKDTGIGIAKQNLEKIFERFSQESETVARNYGGLGLGLSIAKENTHLLGGEISVESAPGVGSVFNISIPYTAAEVSQSLMFHHNEGDFCFMPASVLIVEDDQNNLRYFNAVIAKKFPSIKIIQAGNGQEAVKIALSDTQIDLVLMDIKMPVMDGYEATRKIKEVKPDLPVIIQTAFTNQEESYVAFDAGCDDYITKPIVEEVLENILKKYLVNKRQKIKLS